MAETTESCEYEEFDPCESSSLEEFDPEGTEDAIKNIRESGQELNNTVSDKEETDNDIHLYYSDNECANEYDEFDPVEEESVLENCDKSQTNEESVLGNCDKSQTNEESVLENYDKFDTTEEFLLDKCDENQGTLDKYKVLESKPNVNEYTRDNFVQVKLVGRDGILQTDLSISIEYNLKSLENTIDYTCIIPGDDLEELERTLELDGGLFEDMIKLSNIVDVSIEDFSHKTLQNESVSENAVSRVPSNPENISSGNVIDSFTESGFNETILNSNYLEKDLNSIEEIRGSFNYNDYSLSPLIPKKQKIYDHNSYNSEDSACYDIMSSDANVVPKPTMIEYSLASVIMDDNAKLSINDFSSDLENSALLNDSFTKKKNRKRKRVVVYDSDSNNDTFEKRKTTNTELEVTEVAIFHDNFEKHDSHSENSDLDDMNPVKPKKNNSYECKDKSVPDEDFLKNLYVPESSEGGKYYTKDACCPYCYKIYKRLDIHLLSQHLDKETVKAINCLPKGSKERRLEIRKLRLHGNNKHNNDPTINKTGRLLVSRRLSKNNVKKKNVNEIQTSESDLESGEDNLVRKIKNYDLKKSGKENISQDKRSVSKKFSRIKCSACPEYISRRNISVHYNRYHSTDKKNNNVRSILRSCRNENEIIHPLACDRVKKEILSTLRVNEVFDLIRFDPMIILYLNYICDRYDIKDQNKLIRANARTLGHFVKTMISINPTVNNLETCINSRYWNDTVTAVRIIGKFDKKRRTFESPSTAQLLGLIIKTVIKVLKSYYNQKQDRTGYRNVRSFEVEFEAHWTNSIGSKIVSSQNIIKRHGLGKTVPAVTSKDKKTLIEFLDSRRRVLFKSINKKFTVDKYENLIQVEMIYLQCCNGRRPLEIDRPYIIDYKFKKRVPAMNGEKQENDSFVMETKGKKLHGLDGRVYLKKIDIEIIDYLIHHRSEAGVSVKNPYLFAIKSNKEEDHLDAHYTMKKLVDICHTKYKAFEMKENVLATGIRKYISTQYKSRKDVHEHKTMLLRHLAHSEKTHNAHYCEITPEESIVVTEILDSIILSDKPVDKPKATSNNLSGCSLYDSNESSDEIPQEKTSKEKVIQKTASKTRWSLDVLGDLEVAFADELKSKKYPSQKKIRSVIEDFPTLKLKGAKAITAKFQSILKK